MYNIHNYDLQNMVKRVESTTRMDVAKGTKVRGYDLYLADLVVEESKDSKFYNSEQSVMANYATTNMLEEHFGKV